MIRKNWVDRLKGIEKLKLAAEFNKRKAIDDIEELTFMISAIKKKIKTFKQSLHRITIMEPEETPEEPVDKTDDAENEDSD